MTNLQPYTHLSPEVIIDAVESVGLLSDRCLLPLNSYENRVYQIGIEENEPVIVKFYRPQRWSDEQILEEHAFLNELCDIDVPVIAPIAFNESTLHFFEGFRFAIFKRQGGQAPELDNLDNLYQLGRFIGRIHRCGQSNAFRYRQALTVESHGTASQQFLLENNFIPDSLADAYKAISTEILGIVKKTMNDVSSPSIRLHGDCHPGNILWRNDSPHFVDFDDCVSGPAIQDLWMLLSGSRDNRTRQMVEIIDGYNEFHEFYPVELRLIESLRALRIMHYSAWLARRWEDPAFPHNFPWFNTERYWGEHILELKEQLSSLLEDPIELPTQ